MKGCREDPKMAVDELIQELGYAQSQDNWIALDASRSDYPIYALRRAAAQATDPQAKAKVRGAYVFHTSSPDDSPALPPSVAVYVAQAQDAASARELHKSLWNLGNAPFLIVVLPNEVRVYKGFSYDPVSENRDIIHPLLDPTLHTVREALSAFYAEEIDSGRIWQTQAKNLSLDTRVDRHLLRDLNSLGDELVKRIPAEVAHALIGKYIYISYLTGRGILSDEWLEKRRLNLDLVLGRGATCAALLELVKALEERFNGSIFPLEATDHVSDEVVSYVASVFRGDDPWSGQHALDFSIYDFSYIPIETLSLIYEQFLHREGQGRRAGAYYTPVPLADYVMCELNQEMPLSPGMRILDPCCGSGVFLVLAYRRLIELESKARPDMKLSPEDLRRILEKNIFGVELNRDACYVAEFSLVLTLLSYVDPPDLHRNEHFKFPELHDKNIFECDFFDDESVFRQRNLHFDWVIGNPPWIILDDKKEEHEFALGWIRRAKRDGRIVDLNRLCDAFCWRSTEVLCQGGHVGFVLHAKSLTNDRCEGFRKSFFGRLDVERVTNFSNLAYVLFSGRAEEPAATLVYGLPDGDSGKLGIVHYGPFAINQVPTRAVRANEERAWSITVCHNEVSTVSSEEAGSGDAQVWKFALWGSYRDKRAVGCLRHLFPITLNDLRKRPGWYLEKGLQQWPADASDADGPLPELAEVPILDPGKMRASRFRFAVPENVLAPIPGNEQYVRRQSGKAGLRVVAAPHAFVTSNFAAYSDSDFALPHAKIGLAASKTDAHHLRALCLVLNSNVFRYLLFFRSSSWGAGRSTIEKYEIDALPVPDLSDEQVRQLAEVHERLSTIERESPPPLLLADDTVPQVPKQTVDLLQEQCDSAVEEVLCIPNSVRQLVRDFWAVRYRLNKGKTSGPPAATPSVSQLTAYAVSLTRHLDSFAKVHHKVSVRQCADYTVCTVEITDCKDKLDPDVAVSRSDLRQAEAALWGLLRQQQSQWVYVQRALRVFDGPRVHVYKTSRLLDWTQSQAALDADDIIAEVLAHPRPA